MRELDNLESLVVEPRYENDAPLGQGHDGSLVYIDDIYVGNGIWEWMKSPEHIALKVEDLYEGWPSEYWPILDALLEDRPDLQDRIKKYKEEHKRG